jgi:hypothetical protein
MLRPFQPTALLVMEHNTTGLKYFCKTSVLNRVHWYKGSGTLWLKHLREHGFDVKVGVFGFYVEEKRCLDAAKKFSEDNNIVEDVNWANSVPEDGRNGACMKGERNPFFGKKHKPESIELARQKKLGKSVNKGAYRSPEHRAKISASLLGRKNPATAKALTGRKLSQATKDKISEKGKGRKFTMEAREKIRQASLAQWARYRANGNKQTPTPAEEQGA